MDNKFKETQIKDIKTIFRNGLNGLDVENKEKIDILIEVLKNQLVSDPKNLTTNDIKNIIDSKGLSVNDVFSDSEIERYAESELDMVDSDSIEETYIDPGDEVYPLIEIKTGDINQIQNGYIAEELKDLYMKLGPNVLLQKLQELNK
jgi:hypothetical protein